MPSKDTCCSIVPYFKVPEGNLEKFKALAGKFVEKAQEEPGCLYYGFTFSGDLAHCREGYASAEDLLSHLEHIGPLLQEALQISEVANLEVHGPEAELAKLREPLTGLNPRYFLLECGFRR